MAEECRIDIYILRLSSLYMYMYVKLEVYITCVIERDLKFQDSTGIRNPGPSDYKLYHWAFGSPVAEVCRIDAHILRP